ncbi:MAG: HDOD domain-containing protein [Gammaproteobacteria bacterium]|nr:MAG: HDOD domain-containing protein [Gammaproteobacteria bacterium]
MLESIAEHCASRRLPAGPWEPECDPAWRWFLLDGEVEVYRGDQLRARLTHEEPAAAFPLPCSEPYRFRLVTSSRVLRLPARYLELAKARWGEKTSGIELHEDDEEATLYFRFREELQRGDFELPAMPDLAVDIGRALDDPRTVNDDIARLVQLDPALTARVMRIVNSAAFAGGIPVSSLQQAVGRLGRQQVRNIVFSCIVKGLFHTSSSVLKARLEKLWKHSCKVAAVSALLARFTPGLDAGRGLLAGLVHDIGAIPLLHAAQNVPELLERPAVLDRLVADMKGEVGRLTLLHWHFDGELARVAQDAEHWYRLGSCVPDYLDIVLVAQLHAFVGEGLHLELPRIDAIPAFHRLALGRLSPRASIAILDEAAREIAEIEGLLH